MSSFPDSAVIFACEGIPAGASAILPLPKGLCRVRDALRHALGPDQVPSEPAIVYMRVACGRLGRTTRRPKHERTLESKAN
jgi:hypothetical protein